MTISHHLRLSLSGDDWDFKPFYGMDWLMRRSHLPNTQDTRGWQRGTVPGSVAHDLLTLGEIPNPYVERNSLLIEWIPQRTWLYRKVFTVPAEMAGRRALLRFEGVDYEAQFFLNGERLGDHRSMYTPALFDVSEQLKFGAENLLVVVLEPAPVEQPQIGRSSLVRTHKSRMAYWWDFCPRMVHLGIWDHVTLHFTGAVRVEDVWVRPRLSPDSSRANVPVTITLDSQTPVMAQMDVTLNLDGAEVARQQMQVALDAGQTTVNVPFALDHPALWWPNGYGDQPIYEACVSVTDLATGFVSDSRAATFGVREIVFVSNETSDTMALPYTLTVNGRKIYINGWNWVPMDVMYGVERPGKLERLLTLARRAHVTLLRVWGGGLIEKEPFYDLCDRLGILVWQEFIQSSSGLDNIPPTEPEFLALLESEARQIIPRKRHHPSLAVWCGGNELTEEHERPLDETHPALGLLRALVQELDPGRMWLPTSPSGRAFFNDLERIERDPLGQHDVHGPWEFQGLTKQYTLYNRATSLLHSEFGAESITNLKTLEVTVSPENRWPVTLDHPTWFHLGAWWVKERRWRESLGEVTALETLVRGTQYLQAEGVRYAIESNRRRQYRNSGSLPWQFNEPYPMAACTSAVDYYGHPKPLYYAVARAYAPVLVAASFATMSWVEQKTFEAALWAANTGLETLNAALHVRLIGITDRLHTADWQAVRLQPNGVTAISSFVYDLAQVDELFFLDLELTGADGQVLARNRYLFTRQPTLASALAQPPAAPIIRADRSNDNSWSVTLRNPGEPAAMFLWLEDARPRGAAGYPYFSDNYFCLLPGEERRVTVTWQNVPVGERQISVEGWNVPSRIIY